MHDSITLLFSHLNNCDSIRPENDSEHIQATTIPHNNHSKKLPNGIFNLDGESSSRKANVQEVLGNVIPKNDNTAENVNISSDSKVKIVEEVAIDSTTATKPEQTANTTEAVPFQFVISAGSDQLQIQEVDSSASRRPSPTRLNLTKNEPEMIIVRPTTRSVLQSKQCSNGSLNNGSKSLPKKQALESRSNKRLLRSLSKKPDLKSVIKAKAHKAKTKPENDTIVFNSVSKKKVNKICASLFKTLKCKFCNRSSFKNEANLQTHYQNVHNFATVKQPSELLMTRFTSNDSKEYFQFRCLVCLKMFENFTALSQHRCTYVQPRTINIPSKKHLTRSKRGTEKVNSVVDLDALPDYANEMEFFKNLGLIRKKNSTFKCSHVKSMQVNVSPKEPSKRTVKSKFSSNDQVIVTLRPIINGTVNGKNGHHRFHQNGFTEMQTRRRTDDHQLRKRTNIPDNVIISLVEKTPITRRLVKH